MSRNWIVESELRNRILRYPADDIETILPQVDTHREVSDIRDVMDFDESELRKILELLDTAGEDVTEPTEFEVMANEILKVAAMSDIPEWVKPEFVGNIKTSGTKLRAFSGKLTGVPVSVWVLKTKGRVYKDRYGKVSVDWTIHPVFEGGKWVVRSRMSFAPATNGSFANDKYKEFIDNDMISGKANNVVFGIKEYILEDEPDERNPERGIDKVVSYHTRDLKNARKFWKKQLAEAKKQLIASDISKEIMSVVKQIAAEKEYVIWGVTEGGSHEEVLMANFKGKPITNKGIAKKLVEILENKYNARKTRIQELDLSGEFDWMKEISSSRKPVKAQLESTLDGLRNDVARKQVGKVLRGILKGIHRDETWRPITKISKTFQSLGYDYDQPRPPRYWASDFWRRNLERIEGKGFPDDHKTWEFEVNFVNNKERPTTIHVKVTANAIGPVGPDRDVWEAYDIDFSAY